MASSARRELSIARKCAHFGNGKVEFWDQISSRWVVWWECQLLTIFDVAHCNSTMSTPHHCQSLHIIDSIIQHHMRAYGGIWEPLAARNMIWETWVWMVVGGWSGVVHGLLLYDVMLVAMTLHIISQAYVWSGMIIYDRIWSYGVIWGHILAYTVQVQQYMVLKW